jgi:uncharacterized protein
VRVLNRTRGQVLAERAWEALSAGARMKGLLGRDGLAASEALYIRPCTSIHSFFMRFVFDALFVDRDGRVLHAIRRMRPWRLSRIVLAAEGVLELPAGALETSGTEVGDQLVFERQPDAPEGRREP